MRLIDADALKREIDADSTDGTIANYVRGVLAATLDRAPTVDAEPVRRGRWGVSDAYLMCSACGERYYVPSLKYSGYTGFGCGKLGRLAYCPNCGAKMDGGDDDAAHLVPLEELFNGVGVGYEENWLMGEDGEEDSFVLDECAWCKGGVVVNDSEIVSRAALDRLYNRPYGLRVWSRKPSVEQREKTPWAG